MVEKNAPWRKTPLDQWSTDTDPAIMADDVWVDKGDIGAEKARTKKTTQDITAESMMGRFMHPQHDVGFGDE